MLFLVKKPFKHAGKLYMAMKRVEFNEPHDRKISDLIRYRFLVELKPTVKEKIAKANTEIGDKVTTGAKDILGAIKNAVTGKPKEEPGKEKTGNTKKGGK